MPLSAGTPAEAAATITQIAAGEDHSCALASDNTVACWGFNSSGQLGNGNTTDALLPVAVTTAGTPLAGKTITQIATGGAHSCAVASDGTAACWGRSNYGQLGNGTKTSATVPVAITKTGTALAGKTITQIATGFQHTCALASDGTAACWGDNRAGQLGNATTATATLPVAVTTAGTPLAGKTITRIATGDSHSCAVNSDGTAACWGRNDSGQLGDGNGPNPAAVPVAVRTSGPALKDKTITRIATGHGHSCALASDSTVACWGRNTEGQMGSGGPSQDFPVAITKTGTPLAGKTITQIATGEFHSCAVTSDGTAACWGDNRAGQLGDATTTEATVPVPLTTTGTPLAGKSITQVATGGAHSCALASDSTVACWGDNAKAQLGNESVRSGSRPAATTFAPGALAGKTITQVATGGHSCALASDSTLACWGPNGAGQLGDGTTTDATVPVAVTTAGTPLAGKTITQIATGDSHSCALASDGTTACWGRNTDGRLGNGTTTDATVPVAVTKTGTALAGKTITQIATGFQHTCALASDGTAACWGEGRYGRLGDGTATDATVPVAVTTAGTPLAGKTITRIATGHYHSCALASDGTAACWGDNEFGQLGNPSVNNPVDPTAKLPVAVTKTGTALAGKTITQIAAGGLHSCALAADSTAACWGRNTEGQMGSGGPPQGFPMAVTKAGSPLAGKTITRIATGYLHSCALASDGTAACWGDNEYGQVGNGHNNTTAPLPIAVTKSGTPLAGKTITQIATGHSHSCAFASGSTVTCWGSNLYGQLGDGKGPLYSTVPVVVVISTTPATVPDAPTIGTATPGNQQVALSWTAPASNGGSPVTGYVVTPSIGAAAQTPISVNSTATTLAVTGLVNGTTYTFKVAAKSAIGTGAQSAASDPVTPAAPTVPGPPTMGTASASFLVTSLTWTAPASDGGSPITGYVVTPYVGATAQAAQTFNSTATAQYITGLTIGTAYTFKVAAKNAIGTGAQSAASNPVTPIGFPFTPFASWDAFVARQLLDFTGTQGTAASRAPYVSQLNAGSVTPSAFINARMNGAWFAPHVAPVARLYWAYFGRIPDYGGVTYWAGRHRTGTSLNTISQGFASSAEFTAKYGSLSNSAFVGLVYTNVLGRSPDTAGLNYWVGQLNAGVTRGKVMTGFSESPEYKTKMAAKVNVVMVYAGMLHRTVTASELAAGTAVPATTLIDQIRFGAAYKSLVT